jgi:peptidoglycan/xylan/chitin deacetylase (PgdA/CDA1 family)
MRLTTRGKVATVLAVATVGFAATGPIANALDPAFPDAPQMLRTAQVSPDVPPAPIEAPRKKPTPPQVKPVAKTVPIPGQPQIRTATGPTKPGVPVAKSTVAKVSPAAKKAISIAALTAQDVPPDHHHVSIDVPQTECPGNPDAIGLSRIIKVDTTGGFYVGATYHTKMPLLNPHEVILTFDDGPRPVTTDRVLKALKDNCTKATFFMIGQMAKAYPAEARKVAEAGMTIAYHTWSHSYKLAHGPLDQSQIEISKGWQAVDQAVYGHSGDKPLTHFFRYPGLFNNHDVNKWFNSLDMGVFAIDAEGHDWLKGHITVADAPNVMNEALNQLVRNDGGILLLHDIKESSSTAIAPLLVELKKRGFKIVHVEPLIPPPPVATGSAGPDNIDTSPAPIANRTVDGFDPAHQAAQEKLGRVGLPSEKPAPLPPYKPTPAARQDAPTTTQSIRPTTASAPAPAPEAKDDGWFSSTARSFKGIGSAIGLW